MPRPRKDSAALNLKIKTNISDKLSEFSENTGLTKTVVVEKALDMYIEEYYKKHPEDKKMKSQIFNNIAQD